MNIKILVLVLVLTLILISFLSPLATEVSAEETHQLLGVWLIDDVDGYYPGLAIIGFYPDNEFVALFGEGSAEGHYQLSESTLSLRGSFTYAEARDYNETFDYSRFGNILWLNDRSYIKLATLEPRIDCPGKLPSRVQPGVIAQTTYTDGTSTRLRSAPSTDAAIVKMVPEGAKFVVIDGPFCDQTFSYWQIHDSEGDIGWIAEGSDYYFIEPLFEIDSLGDTPLQVLTSTGATSYPPGQYPHSSELTSALHEFTSGTVDLGELYIFSKQTNINGLDLVCALLDAQSITALVSEGIIPEPSETSNTICLVVDVVTWAIEGTPIVGGIFIMAEILLNPDNYIDPWLDPVNQFAWSFPMTRTFCWLFNLDCSFLDE